MIVSRESIKQAVDSLDESQLQQVAAFLVGIRGQTALPAPTWEPTQLAALFTEFAAADRALAEAGMDDYAALLTNTEQS
jgi:hypothetical protein